MRKQMEGDNRERREKAKDARDEGMSPSEARVTTGASKQRRHLDQGDRDREQAGQQQPGRHPRRD